MKIKYPEKLIHGYLVKRYKRFLADIRLESGEIVTAHCTNSGSMKSCLEEGAEVYISPNSSPNRKTKFTWEIIKIGQGWVGINTNYPNLLAYEFIKGGIIPGLDRFSHVKREVKFEDSRFDIFAENDEEKCFIEVKNVTLKDGDFARFPDAQTTRGQKHLKTLISVKKSGIRAVMLYIVQRIDVDIFAPAWDIDRIYSDLLIEANNNGVEIFALKIGVSPFGFEPIGLMPVDLSEH